MAPWLTRDFNWDCLHRLVLRIQASSEQDLENAEQIACNAGLTCNWRISGPHIYWVPQNGITLDSFN